MISVSDNGIGFEQQYAEKSFRCLPVCGARLNTADPAWGLSIVKKVMENHNMLQNKIPAKLQ